MHIYVFLISFAKLLDAEHLWFGLRYQWGISFLSMFILLLAQVWTVCGLCSWCSYVLCLPKEKVYWLCWDVLPGIYLYLVPFWYISLLSKFCWYFISLSFFLWWFGCRISWQGNFLLFLVNTRISMIGRIIWQRYFQRFILWLIGWQCMAFHFLFFMDFSIISYSRLDLKDTWRCEVRMEDLGGGCVHYLLSGYFLLICLVCTVFSL